MPHHQAQQIIQHQNPYPYPTHQLQRVASQPQMMSVVEQASASRAEQRKQRLLEVEMEIAAEEAEALKMTEEQRQMLLRPFVTVKAEFADLDGLRWTQTALRMLQPAHRDATTSSLNATNAQLNSEDTIRTSSASIPLPQIHVGNRHRDGSRSRSPIKGLFPSSPSPSPAASSASLDRVASAHAVSTTPATKKSMPSTQDTLTPSASLVPPSPSSVQPPRLRKRKSTLVPLPHGPHPQRDAPSPPTSASASPRSLSSKRPFPSLPRSSASSPDLTPMQALVTSPISVPSIAIPIPPSPGSSSCSASALSTSFTREIRTRIEGARSIIMLGDSLGLGRRARPALVIPSTGFEYPSDGEYDDDDETPTPSPIDYAGVGVAGPGAGTGTGGYAALSKAFPWMPHASPRPVAGSF